MGGALKNKARKWKMAGVKNQDRKDKQGRRILNVMGTRVLTRFYFRHLS